MAYVPDPADASQPTEDKFAKTAAAEFRALKARVNSLVPSLGLGGRFFNAQIIGATAIYTPTPGTNQIILELQAAGGSGGGAGTTGAGQGSIGGGGGAGGFARVWLTSGFSGVLATIPGATGGGVGAAGNTGGTASFGGLVICTGGTGGGLAAATAANAIVGGGLGGSVTINAGGALIQKAGSCAPISWLMAGGFGFGTEGASSEMGAGGVYSGGGANGGNAIGFGGGGGGTYNAPSTAVTRSGGAGGPARLVVYEFT